MERGLPFREESLSFCLSYPAPDFLLRQNPWMGGVVMHEIVHEMMTDEAFVGESWGNDGGGRHCHPVKRRSQVWK